MSSKANGDAHNDVEHTESEYEHNPTSNGRQIPLSVEATPW